MKKIFFGLTLFILVAFYSWSQDVQESMVDTFIANFEKGSPDIKLQVINDAAEMGFPGMGALYQVAVDYVVTNAAALDSNLVLRKISFVAVDKIKVEKYDKAKYSLWNLFKVDTDTQVRLGILKALTDIGVGDEKIIAYLNQWMENQNNIFKTAKTSDFQIIGAAIETIGTFGDPTSFPILFRALIFKYNDTVLAKTEIALKSIKGDLKQLYTNVIRNGLFDERKAALTRVLNDKTLTDSDKCEVAEFSLNIALYTTAPTTPDKDLARETRYIATNFLGDKKWSNATQLLIDHFNKAVAELDRGIGFKGNLVDAITALGNMQNHEAAKRLTLYLDLINSFTENSKVYDEQIVLAVIASLSKLGDMVANSTLLYTRYLNYNETVKKAATAALKNLK